MTEYVSIKRDGLTLFGKLMKSEKEKGPIVIMFHGFTGDLDENENSMFETISRGVLKKGISTIRFDFNGHGRSEGDFTNMNLFNELNDAIAIIEYVRKLDFVTDIYLVGHSMGGVVAGMIAGYYHDVVKKLVLLEPAAYLKDDAINGECALARFDPKHIPEKVDVYQNGSFLVGGHFYRIAQMLPIYEVTAQYKKAMLVIHSETDEVVPTVSATRYREHMSNAQLQIFQRMNHNMEGEDHDEAMEMVVTFL